MVPENLSYANAAATHQQMAPLVNVSEASAPPEINLKIIPRNENNLKNHSNRTAITNRSRVNNNPIIMSIGLHDTVLCSSGSDYVSPSPMYCTYFAFLSNIGL
ncbi:hypothetical protein NPIL_352931 [Nephila pilipes]|uniref:Uncharacterized protein n=1 Tax=Nephila pilipes TaxID=299642 RepID=A0A8X6PKY6_NEPPI|nr:hypothetical protein NPIL_352931 [Nephila pilipes]